MFDFFNEGDKEESSAVVVSDDEELLQSSKSTPNADESVCIYILLMNCILNVHGMDT